MELLVLLVLLTLLTRVAHPLENSQQLTSDFVYSVTAARAAVRCSWGYRLMASTDGGGVNVTAERPQERRTWRASERDGHGPRY